MITVAKQTETNFVDSFEADVTMGTRYSILKMVQLRIDFFQTWLPKQSAKDQEVIYDLAIGETIYDVARKYGVTRVEVTQWQQNYADSWYAFINPRKTPAKKKTA